MKAAAKDEASKQTANAAEAVKKRVQSLRANLTVRQGPENERKVELID